MSKDKQHRAEAAALLVEQLKSQRGRAPKVGRAILVVQLLWLAWGTWITVKVCSRSSPASSSTPGIAAVSSPSYAVR